MAEFEQASVGIGGKVALGLEAKARQLLVVFLKE